jgi:hypothetical protein
MENEQEQQKELFAVFAVRRGDPKPVIQTHLPFGRLMDDIVIPYDTEKVFFIDGAPVKATELERIKIMMQKDTFDRIFHDLHRSMRFGRDLKKQELYAQQYHIRLEALLRESGEDVTSQVIKAYRTVIKPELKDYLPDRQELLGAAVKVFKEGVKLLAGD